MKLLRFFEFILENKEEILLPITFSHNFIDRIYSISSPISDKIKTTFLKRQIPLGKYCLISEGKSGDTVEYTDSSKISSFFKNRFKGISDKSIEEILKNRSFEIDDEIWTTNRTEIKIGRFVKKLFGDEFSDSEIESFVNIWKSKENTSSTFEIWKGKDIAEGYMTSNYFPALNTISNPLIKSCMNSRMDLVDFYSHCSVSLLVLLDNGLILGRALVWKDYQGRIIMDRVYYIYDKDYYKFLEYAKEQGWYFKKKNISGDSPFVKDGQEVKLKTKVKIPDVVKYNIDKGEDSIPYMDTFNTSQGEWAMNYEPDEYPYYNLIDTEGKYQEITGEECDWD